VHCAGVGRVRDAIPRFPESTLAPAYRKPVDRLPCQCGFAGACTARRGGVIISRYGIMPALRPYRPAWLPWRVGVQRHLASIHRVNAGDRFRGGTAECDLDRGVRACSSCRLPVLRPVRVFRGREIGLVAWAAVRSGAGQAGWACGGPWVASKRFSHSRARCQPSGRCTVMWPRPWRAIRAASAIRSRPWLWRRTPRPALRRRTASCASWLAAPAMRR
jgi:hypothetical protein